ncbi:hypothetical protein EDC01DRAFT_774964 [Geopyxis carbonaria]|nr:hypothetical protein EDC01DRAFT_774964 [Geopyxis carbonaria]
MCRLLWTILAHFQPKLTGTHPTVIENILQKQPTAPPATAETKLNKLPTPDAKTMSLERIAAVFEGERETDNEKDETGSGDDIVEFYVEDKMTERMVVQMHEVRPRHRDGTSSMIERKQVLVDEKDNMYNRARVISQCAVVEHVDECFEDFDAARVKSQYAVVEHVDDYFDDFDGAFETRSSLISGTTEEKEATSRQEVVEVIPVGLEMGDAPKELSRGFRPDSAYAEKDGSDCKMMTLKQASLQDVEKQLMEARPTVHEDITSEETIVERKPSDTQESGMEMEELTPSKADKGKQPLREVGIAITADYPVESAHQKLVHAIRNCYEQSRPGPFENRDSTIPGTAPPTYHSRNSAYDPISPLDPTAPTSPVSNAECQCPGMTFLRTATAQAANEDNMRALLAQTEFAKNYEKTYKRGTKILTWIFIAMIAAIVGSVQVLALTGMPLWAVVVVPCGVATLGLGVMKMWMLRCEKREKGMLDLEAGLGR